MRIPMQGDTRSNEHIDDQDSRKSNCQMMVTGPFVARDNVAIAKSVLPKPALPKTVITNAVIFDAVSAGQLNLG